MWRPLITFRLENIEMKLLKTLKAANKGILAKYKRKLAVSQDSILYCDMDQSVTVSRTPDYSATLQEFDSIAAFELAGIDNVDLESMPIVEGAIVLDQHDIETMAWAALVCDNESTRYSLGGVLLTENKIVGTDGRRMHVGTLSAQFPESSDRIIPERAISTLVELCKIWKDTRIQVVVAANSITFIGQYWKFNSRLIDGRFPNWQQVIPSERDTEKTRDVYTSGILAQCADTIKRTALENKVALSKCTKSERKSFVEKTPLIDLYSTYLDCRYIVDAVGKLPRVDFRYPESLNNRLSMPLTISTITRLAVLMPCKFPG